MRSTFRRLLCSAVIGVMAHPSLGHAAPSNRFGLEDKNAVRHAEAAARAAQNDDYETAIRELKSAYSLEPRPILLYAWAQAERLGGHCNRAIKLYQDFLSTEPEQALANQARVNLLDCKAETGGGAVPPAPDTDDDPPDDDDPPQAAAEQGEDPIDGPADDTSALRKERLAPILLGVGAAALIGGGVALGLGRARVANSNDSTTEMQYFDEVDGGRRTYIAGAVVMGVGGALLVGGALRYVLVVRRARQARTTPSAMVGPRGFSLSLETRF